MGAVYKARHKKMDRLVALKVIHAKLLDNPKAVERFSSQRMAEFEAELLMTCAGFASSIFAWIVLPNHDHLLLQSSELKAAGAFRLKAELQPLEFRLQAECAGRAPTGASADTSQILGYTVLGWRGRGHDDGADRHDGQAAVHGAARRHLRASRPGRGPEHAVRVA